MIVVAMLYTPMFSFGNYFLYRENWTRWGGVSEKEFTLNTEIGPVTYRVQASVVPAARFPNIRQKMQEINGPYDNRWQVTKFDFGVARGSATDYKLTNLNNGTAVMRNVINTLIEYMSNDQNKTPLVVVEPMSDDLDGRMATYLSLIMRYASKLRYSPYVLDHKTILLLNHKVLENPEADSQWLDADSQDRLGQWKAQRIRNPKPPVHSSPSEPQRSSYATGVS
jgi:hypothetical protein